MANLIAVMQVVGTSALTSLLFGFINSCLDRRARRKELLFTRAFQLAKDRTELIKEVASKTGGEAKLRDNVFLAKEYYKWLEHFYDSGDLPAEAYKVETESKK